MTLNELKELKEKTAKLGIFTSEDLDLFYSTEKIHNESLLDTVRRYYEDFRNELKNIKMTIQVR